MLIKYKLQPLRIPSPWTVGYNTFTEIDPLSIKNADSDEWWEFNEDMFQASSTHFNLTIDLGWRPSNDSKGTFYLVQVYHQQPDDLKLGSWQQPLKKISTNDKSLVVATIEEWMNIC